VDRGGPDIGKRPDEIVREHAPVPDDPIGNEGTARGVSPDLTRRRQPDLAKRAEWPGRAQRAAFYAANGRMAEAKDLAREVAQGFPGAVGHDGRRLVDTRRSLGLL
jgi:hypothetical protein